MIGFTGYESFLLAASASLPVLPECGGLPLLPPGVPRLPRHLPVAAPAPGPRLLPPSPRYRDIRRSGQMI